MVSGLLCVVQRFWFKQWVDVGDVLQAIVRGAAQSAEGCLLFDVQVSC